MVKGTHFGGEVEEPRTLLQIHHGVVGLQISGQAGKAKSEFDRLFNIVVILIDAFLLVSLLRARQGREQQSRRDRQKKKPADLRLQGLGVLFVS